MEHILQFARRRKPNYVCLANVRLEVIPKTRDELLKMKSDREEAERKECIEEVISWLYQRIIAAANRSSDTSYKIELLTASSKQNMAAQYASQYASQCTSRPTMLSDPNDIYYKSFILEAQDEILQHLRNTFPGCSIEIKTLSKAADGKMYDVSTLDETALRFVDRRQDQTHLIVDWS